jgi:hypothetical protein
MTSAADPTALDRKENAFQASQYGTLVRQRSLFGTSSLEDDGVDAADSGEDRHRRRAD